MSLGTAPSSLQITPLLGQKHRFLLKFCENQVLRSCGSYSPKPGGVCAATYIMAWGLRGAAGRASAHPSPPHLLPGAEPKHVPSKVQGPLPSPLYHHFSMQKMNHHATQGRARLWKGGRPQPLGSPQQNIRVGYFSYSFGWSYYHCPAEKLPQMAVMLKPNLHITWYTCTRGADAAWKKVYPPQRLSLADAQPQRLLQQEPSSPGDPSLTSRMRASVLSRTGIDAWEQ